MSTAVCFNFFFLAIANASVRLHFDFFGIFLLNGKLNVSGNSSSYFHSLKYNLSVKELSAPPFRVLPLGRLSSQFTRKISNAKTDIYLGIDVCLIASIIS